MLEDVLYVGCENRSARPSDYLLYLSCVVCSLDSLVIKKILVIGDGGNNRIILTHCLEAFLRFLCDVMIFRCISI